jgi:hypothetical protein
MAIDWLTVLNLDQALRNVRGEFYGDWYRDPWSWPELTWAVAENDASHFLSRLKDPRVRRPALLDVPKSNFGTRPAMVMDIADRVAYQAVVDLQSRQLIGSLDHWVYGWRLIPNDPVAGKYANNGYQWENYFGHLLEQADTYDACLETDVVSFFSSVPLDALIENVVERAGGGLVTERLIQYVEGWGAVADRGGLAQRCSASSVLAHFAIRQLDDAIRELGYQLGDGGEPSVCRWMDDIWLFGRDAGRLRAAQVEIERVMRSLGLNMNIGKTVLTEGEEMRSRVAAVAHSHEEYALTSAAAPGLVLEPVIERVLENPSLASRSSVRWVTRRMRELQHFDQVETFVDSAWHMPHCADLLARLFRESGVWVDLVDWFIDYSVSPWALQWSAGQLATMFPQRGDVEGRLDDTFRSWIRQGTSLTRTATAAQRLSVWSPELARYEIDLRLARSDSPLERRVLSLAGHAAGAERRWVRASLNEYEENKFVLDMLESRDFPTLPVAKDFSGD